MTTALPVEGSCRCGRVKLRISAPPMLTMACHCTGCQKMTAGPFSLSAMIPAAGFEVVEGETVIGGLHGPDLNHHHCPHCMSWMFTTVPAADFFVNVRATMLEAPDWQKPTWRPAPSRSCPG
ncbi:MAG: GFA family protein [Caulobacter sp.]|nr:GFA family protein [Caulobacter sp.]